MFKKLNKKGFTLAELLVVVAIIGVLVAISIPIFTSQLEKAKEATDAANFRAAYAEAQVANLDNDASDTCSFFAITFAEKSISCPLEIKKSAMVLSADVNLS